MRLNEISENFKLLTNYSPNNTLSENYESIVLNENYRETAVAVSQTLKDILQGERELFQSLKTDIPLFRKFNSSDDLINALENVGKDGSKISNTEILSMAKDLNKIPEIFSKFKGLISKSDSFFEISKTVYPNGLAMGPNIQKLENTKKYYKQFGIEGEDVEKMLVDSLEKGGASKIKKSVSKRKSNKSIEQEIESSKNIKSEEELMSLETGKGKWSGIQRLAKRKGLKVLAYLRKLGWRKVLMYVGAGWLLYYIWRNWITERPKIWSDCLLNFIGYDKFSKVTKDEGGGVISVYSYTGIRALDMNGKTYFKNDGTATNGQFEGEWRCDGDKLVLEFDGEEFYPIKKGEEKKPTPTPTPAPSPSPNPSPVINQSRYKQCNSFPYTKYCKGPVISEIQKCLGVTVDSYFGPETDNALFKQYGTHSVTQSIYDQIKAKCGGTPTNITQVITPIVNNDNILEPTPSTDEV